MGNKSTGREIKVSKNRLSGSASKSSASNSSDILTFTKFIRDVGHFTTVEYGRRSCEVVLIVLQLRILYCKNSWPLLDPTTSGSAVMFCSVAG